MNEKLGLIVNSQEYYFQKLEDAFKKFDDYKISNNQIDILIDKVSKFYDNNKSKNNKFLEFIEENKEFKEVFNLIGQIISMCDLNASNKEYFNPYDDNRVVAKAGVRQNDWIINLLKYKKNGLEEIPPSIKATIEYIKDPENNLTVLSKNHKNLISKKLLNREYSQDTFISKLKEYFDKELNNYQVINKKNINIIISNLLYTNEIKNIWLSEQYIEDAFKKWLLSIKKLETSTFDKYTSRLKNGIPQKLIDVKFKTKKESLYTLTSSDLMKINELFEENSYDLQSWNKDKTKTEASNSLKYLIEFFNNNEEFVTVSEKLKGKYNMSTNSKLPLNQILYGSPGTGKTYNTINKALEIIFEKEDKEKEFEFKIKDEKDNDKETIKKSYKEILNITEENEKRKHLKGLFEYFKDEQRGQIEFVTFHQSYGYEEFVEGIKAETKDKDISYEIKAGIFKSLVEKSLSKGELASSNEKISEKNVIWKMSLGDSQSGEDKEYFDEAIKTNCLIMGYGGDEDFTSFLKKENFQDKNIDKTTIDMLDRFKNQMKKGDIVIISDGNRKFKAIAIVEGDYFYDTESIYKQKRKIKWLQRFTISRDVKEISEKNFTQVTLNKPQWINLDKLNSLISNDKQADNTNKNYVLIIDEINRGNISKIFGELITLIEPSKRIGADEEIRVKLPYSGDSEEPFGVPQNLYIIGTMNTADRSIAPIDTALRRRFVFEEMAPKSDLLSENIEGVNLQSLLEAINTRIEYLYDRDHTIGHAYLIDVKTLPDLRFAFKNKIIPLLAEYFYEDWENIDLVLNKNGMIEEEKSNSDYLKNLNKINGKKIYKVSDKNWEVENFQKIYDDSVF